MCNSKREYEKSKEIHLVEMVHKISKSIAFNLDYETVTVYFLFSSLYKKGVHKNLVILIQICDK